VKFERPAPNDPGRPPGLAVRFFARAVDVVLLSVPPWLYGILVVRRSAIACSACAS
jgi:hypothetical protein